MKEKDLKFSKLSSPAVVLEQDSGLESPVKNKPESDEKVTKKNDEKSQKKEKRVEPQEKKVKHIVPDNSVTDDGW